MSVLQHPYLVEVIDYEDFRFVLLWLLLNYCEEAF